ncbi:MAG: thioredoxin domain-containing protein [Gemmatimonadota bacterium]
MANRLASEASPYLQQHAGNPVDWFPWGDEAFEAARRLDRPVLLSIGYAACHWCHVMEHESFSDPATAALMNERFVNIKVDREERPDVDHVYMTAVQVLTGHGGWPLTVFLTPSGEPFFGGTYFPPTPRGGMPAFRQVLASVARAWSDRSEEVRSQAAELRSLLERSTRVDPNTISPDFAWVQRAVRHARASFDPVHGGFGGAPKFPQPALLEFLFGWRAHTGDEATLAMVVATLAAMARGGIRDHLGGGFHRYAVDARWQVPHFEKMLYDNAQLARVYLRAWQITGDPRWRRVCEQTLDYVAADLTAPEGGFYCSRDADSEGEEGRYYVWQASEIDAVLGEDADVFKRAYGVTAAGNWEGANILRRNEETEDGGHGAAGDDPSLAARLQAARTLLLQMRSRRTPPGLDDKVLTDWSALTVRAFAEAGAALGRADYLALAERATRFLLEHLREGEVVLHSWRRGRSGRGAFLTDAAALGNALLSLYEATLEPSWAREAAAVAHALLDRFAESGEALLYDTPAQGEALIVRPRDPTDGALPSGNALAAELFLRLGRLLGRPDFVERARAIVDALAGLVDRHPLAFGYLLHVAESLRSDPVEVTLVGTPHGVAPLHREVSQRYLPGLVLAGPDLPDSPLLRDRPSLEGAPTAYVCWHRTCSAPLTDPAALATELNRVGHPGGQG